MTKVDKGNAVTDFDEAEIARKLTIMTALVSFAWQRNKFNLADAPGYNIFLNEAREVLAQAALLLSKRLAPVAEL